MIGDGVGHGFALGRAPAETVPSAVDDRITMQTHVEWSAARRYYRFDEKSVRGESQSCSLLGMRLNSSIGADDPTISS